MEATYAKAIAAGGKAWMPAQDLGFMHGASFLDLDDHVWEIVWMDPAAVQPAGASGNPSRPKPPPSVPPPG